jgi:hypothetical protein
MSELPLNQRAKLEREKRTKGQQEEQEERTKGKPVDQEVQEVQRTETSRTVRRHTPQG